MIDTPFAVGSPDGARIAVWRGGRGEPLVAVHGTSADHTRWSRVRPLLEEHFTVFALDRRGRGASGDAAEYAIEREVEDVAAVVDAVGSPVTLVGHSYGGICALHAALGNASVRRLVLYEPPLPTEALIYAPGLVDRLDGLLAGGDLEGILTTFMTDVVRMPPAEVEHFRTLPEWGARVDAAHTIVREIHAHEAYAFAPVRFRELETPTLLLLGTDSPPFFGAAIELLHATLPNATLRLLDGQQHVAMEIAPQLFAGEILRFAAV